MKIKLTLVEKEDPKRKDIESTLKANRRAKSPIYVVRDSFGEDLYLYNKCKWNSKNSLSYSINNFIRGNLARLGEDTTKTSSEITRIRQRLIKSGYLNIIETIL